MKKFLDQLNFFDPQYPEEVSFKRRMIKLIYKEKKNAFSRQLTTGHFTASAWVLSADYHKALLLHHKKLNLWLQPGGHADGVEDLEKVAHKEANEETGLEKLTLLSENIFDLDIHEIPAKKEVAAHLHYDVRYLFRASSDEMVQINEESNDYKWITLEDLIKESNNQSIIRMVKKSLNLL